MELKLTTSRLEILAKYFVDLSKILFASAIVGFFIPGFSEKVDLSTFVFGSVIALGFLVLGVLIIEEKNYE